MFTTVTIANTKKWEADQQKINIFLIVSTDNNARANIKDFFKTKEIWDKLAALYKPKRSGHLNRVYAKFIDLILESCGNKIEDYITEFQKAMDELRDFTV